MWKVTVLSAFMFSLLLSKASPKPFESELTVDDYRWKCFKQCKKVSGEMDFDEKTLTCKCTIITNVNDAEMAIVEQNAKLLNLDLAPSEEITKTNFRKKRFISPNHEKKIFSKFDHTEEKDHIVGQPPVVLPPPNPLLPNRPLITQDAALRNLADIRNKLRDLSNHSARNAAAHAEAIRHSLKELSNRVIIAPTPEQRHNRARINQDRKARERQRIHRLNNFRIKGGVVPRKPVGVLGASAKEDNDVTTVVPPKKGNRKQSIKKSDDEFVQHDVHSGIITQPSEYIED